MLHMPGSVLGTPTPDVLKNFMVRPYADKASSPILSGEAVSLHLAPGNRDYHAIASMRVQYEAMALGLPTFLSQFSWPQLFCIKQELGFQVW